MKKRLLSVAFLVGLFVATIPLHAQIAQFQGNWINTNSATSSLVRLAIRGTEVHPFGKCHPNPCDWGELDGVAYGPNAGADVRRSAKAIVATRHTSYSVVILVIRPARNNGLRVSTLTRFTDNSGRAPYVVTEFFRRGARLRGGTVPFVRERARRP